MSAVLTSEMLVGACLSQRPEERFSADSVAAMVGGMNRAIAARALLRQASIDVISHEKPAPGRVRYYVTREQADAIQGQLREIVISVARWLVDAAPAEPVLPPTSLLLPVRGKS